MKPKILAFALLALTAGQAGAATWTGSDSNALTAGSGYMRISFTGDGYTTDALVDVAVPPGFSIVSTIGRNGGTCARQGGTNYVRVLVISSAGTPLPSASRVHCDIRVYTPNTHGTYTFPMGYSECFDIYGSFTSCTLDPGTIRVIPRI